MILCLPHFVFLLRSGFPPAAPGTACNTSVKQKSFFTAVKADFAYTGQLPVKGRYPAGIDNAGLGSTEKVTRESVCQLRQRPVSAKHPVGGVCGNAVVRGRKEENFLQGNNMLPPAKRQQHISSRRQTVRLYPFLQLPDFRSYRMTADDNLFFCLRIDLYPHIRFHVRPPFVSPPPHFLYGE